MGMGDVGCVGIAIVSVILCFNAVGYGYYIIIMMTHDDVRCMMLQLQHYHYHHVRCSLVKHL